MFPGNTGAYESGGSTPSAVCTIGDEEPTSCVQVSQGTEGTGSVNDYGWEISLFGQLSGNKEYTRPSNPTQIV
jgi:hypothetical protein